MKSRLLKSIAFAAVGLLLAVVLLTLSFGRVRSTFGRRMSSSIAIANDKRPIVLWAWERPTDLSFADPTVVSVAFLAKTIRLASNEVIVRPRLQPLKLPESIGLTAVARIETDRKQTSTLSFNQREKSSRAIAEMASLPNVSEIQIDFDATQSERQFYRDLITDVRNRLPPNVRLSITALASWCMSNDWISDLPIDEAVPMLFRMAADGKHIADRLDGGSDFPAAPCRHSYGISLDERRPALKSSRRLFVFNPGAWSEKSVRKILESPK